MPDSNSPDLQIPISRSNSSYTSTSAQLISHGGDASILRYHSFLGGEENIPLRSPELQSQSETVEFQIPTTSSMPILRAIPNVNSRKKSSASRFTRTRWGGFFFFLAQKLNRVVIRRIAEEKRTDVAIKNKKRGCLASCNYLWNMSSRIQSVDGAVPSSRPFTQLPQFLTACHRWGGGGKLLATPPEARRRKKKKRKRHSACGT
ncbi:hypothetical protein V8C34DRAFT_51405 [Trichoderma compactum]